MVRTRATISTVYRPCGMCLYITHSRRMQEVADSTHRSAHYPSHPRPFQSVSVPWTTGMLRAEEIGILLCARSSLTAETRLQRVILLAVVTRRTGGGRTHMPTTSTSTLRFSLRNPYKCNTFVHVTEQEAHNVFCM